MKRIYYFLKYNKAKKLTIVIWILAAFFRFCMLFIPAKIMKKYYGTEGKESSREASKYEYYHAQRISHYVRRVGDRTPWESKCLVQALTAQKLLARKKIHSTMYLGVGHLNGEMVAHAWTRVGEYYVTGGKGENSYSVVAKFMK